MSLSPPEAPDERSPWIVRAADRRVVQVLRRGSCRGQLLPQVLGKGQRIALIMHDVRRDQHKKLVPGPRVALLAEQRSDHRNVLQEWHALIALRDAILNQSGKADGLAVLYHDPGLDVTLIEGRRGDAAVADRRARRCVD